MNTDELINALAADTGRHSLPQDRVWTMAGAAAVLIAAAVFFNTIGPRPDIAAAAATVRFLFKFVMTLSLAATSFLVLDRLARPGAGGTRYLPWLLLAPALLLAAVGLELMVRPEAQWQMLAIGKNSLACLTWIPLIGVGPLAVFIFTLRRAAPTRPGLSGVVAGLVAGGVAATFYAANCTDDSPLFVATWYPLAVAILGTLGGLAGRIFARW